MRYLFPTALIALTLAGCVAPPPAREVRPVPVAPPVSPPTPVPPPLAADWNDWPFTPGDWQYQQARHDSTARFADRVTISCEPMTRQIVIGGLANATMTIRTTSMTRSITPVTPNRLAMGSIATFAATDSLLDAIAFSRGRFVIEQKGAPPLVLPPYAEIGRVIEDCRG